MSEGREPLFLARQTYRRRRVADAARLLPLLGVLLLLLPLLSSGQDGDTGAAGVQTSRGGIYIFLVWAGLIGAASLLARPLSGRDPQPDTQPETRPDTWPGDGEGQR